MFGRTRAFLSCLQLFWNPSIHPSIQQPYSDSHVLFVLVLFLLMYLSFSHSFLRF